MDCFIDNNHDRKGGSATRGFGLLENILARQRYRMADSLIADGQRQGKILDIGCGEFPEFLTQTPFKEKVGLEKIPREQRHEAADVVMVDFDFDHQDRMPLGDEDVDVVTMLAVAEHLEIEQLRVCFKEVFRILKTNGTFILTLPAFWTEPVLKILARLGLVSSVEIAEHKCHYKAEQLKPLLASAGFAREYLQYGYFECFMNMWVRVDKK